jgi:hypothetical protein
MNVPKVAINVGIGDIITAKSYLLDYIHKGVTKIIVQPSHRYLHLRGAGYGQFVDQFSRLVYHEPQFTIIPGDTQLESTHWASLMKQGLKQHNVDLTTALPLERPVPSVPYLCLNTKVRQYNYQRFLDIKQSFLKVLRKLCEHKVLVIMGERTVEQNIEYSIHGTDVIYSIYGHLEDLPKDKVIDMTVPALGLTVPDLHALRQDCHIMAKSEGVINIGYGGNLALSGSVAKTYNLIGPNVVYEGANVVEVIHGMFGNRAQNFLDEGMFLDTLGR